MLKLSIIVPVYNVEKYINKCLDSLVNQTMQDIEILVINDGSPDSSLEIAEVYADKYDYVKVYTKENGGLSDARNYGMKYANGEYLAFIDSDDYIDNQMMEKMYLMAKKHDSDIVCCDMYYVENEELKYSSGANFEVSSFNDNPGIISINNSACNKLYRREFMNGKEFPKGLWYEDLAVIPFWVALANNVSHVGKPLYYYIQRSGSIAHSINPKIFDIYKAISNIDNNLKANGFSEYSDSINDIYLNNCLIMTTLRIKNYDDNKIKTELIEENMKHLNESLPEWYQETKKRSFSFKQRVLFYLLKKNMYTIVIKAFR